MDRARSHRVPCRTKTILRFSRFYDAGISLTSCVKTKSAQVFLTFRASLQLKLTGQKRPRSIAFAVEAAHASQLYPIAEAL